MENLKCDICRLYSSHISYFNCEHKSCYDCFYKISLYNKNIIKHFNNDIEKEVDLKCLMCPSGKLSISKPKIIEKLNGKIIKAGEAFEHCDAHNKEIKVYCAQCKSLMCPDCFYSHKALPMFVSHQKGENPKTKTTSNTIGCRKHEDLQYYYYCTECAQPLCEVCKSTEHEGHKRIYIGDFYNAKKDEIKLQLKIPYKNLKEIQNKIDDSDRISKIELKKQVTYIKDKIQHFVNYLNEIKNGLDKTVEIYNEEMKLNSTILKILYEKLFQDLNILSETPDIYFNYEYLSKLPKNFRLNRKQVKLEEKLEEALLGMKKIIELNNNMNCPIIIRNINEDFIASNTLSGHNGHIRNIIQLDDGKLATASDDKTIKIWNLDDNFVCTESVEGHSSNVYSITKLQSGKIATGSSDNTIKIWDPLNGFNCIHTLEGHTNNIYSLIQIKDGRLISGSGDKSIIFWNTINNYNNSHSIRGLSSGVKIIIQLKDTRLATGLDDGTIIICDLKDRYKFTHNIKGHHKSVQTLVQLKDSRIVSGSVDKTIKLWDTSDHFNNLLTLNVHTNAVWSLIQLEDGRLVSGSGDYTIRIWDPQENFKCTHTLNGHYFGVHSLIQMKDGRIASGSGDKTVRIWE